MALEERDPDPELSTNSTWRRLMVRARKEHGAESGDGGMTQTELARKVGTSQVVISQIETGIITGSKYIRPICRALKIPEPIAFENPDDAAWHELGRLLRAKGDRKFLVVKQMVEEMVGVSDADDETTRSAPIENSDPKRPRS